MAKTKSVELDALDRDGCGVRAVFTSSGDHYATAIVAVIDGVASPLLESDSATPLQEAVKHSPLEAPPAVLLTGAGDGNYWSATVTPITDIHFALLGFDFACRRRRGSTDPSLAYQFASGVDVNPQSDDGVLFRARGREFLLRAAEMPTSLSTEGVPTCRLVTSRNGVTIEPLSSAHVSTRSTVQWRFEISAIRPR